MNLVSYAQCGVVIDADKRKFPDNIYKTNGEIDFEKADWNGDNYVAKIICPVCEYVILSET